MKRRRPVEIVSLLFIVLSISWIPLFSKKKSSDNELKKFVINYESHLNKKFVKIERAQTLYIIVHTSEGGLNGTLTTLSEGKNVGTYRTIGGHANYTIARDGKVYRILNHKYRADHAGLSMWDGHEDISSFSVGIELVGYHYDTITSDQYKSLSRLLKILQRIYTIPDENVLTHSQVSYGRPNIWHKSYHRGRKRCALNFERNKAGLAEAWSFDPDVKEGRLAGDPYIYNVFYKNVPHAVKPQPTEIIPEDKTIADAQKTEPVPTLSPVEEEKISNIISKANTAWNIAGEDFDNSTTLYMLPDNRAIRGDKMEQEVGWAKIPNGTKVLLNEPENFEKNTGPLLLITKECTAWSFAGRDYNKPTTYYFLPDLRAIPGDKMPDWDSLPDGTYMIVGYNANFLQPVKGKTAWGLAGKAHNQPETIYFIPGVGVITGDKIQNFSNLPSGSILFLKIIK